MSRKIKGGQRIEFPTHKCSTQRNVRLLNFRVRKGIGCNQSAVAVQIEGIKKHL